MAKDCYLVTGASAGLGAGFAAAIAAQGHDLILVARRADRLETLAAELRQHHGVAVTAIPADLTEAGAIAALMAEIEQQGLTVTHLINNAGFGLRGRFDEMDGPSQARMIDCNCRAPMELAHAVLPGMIAAGRGGILNVASTAAFQPGPWMAVYYASKAFLLSFSEAIHHEVKDRGVTVAALCPGPTRTEFFDVADMRDSALSRFMSGEPDKVIEDGLKALASNKAVVVSGALNATVAASIRITPRPIARRIAGSLQKARR
jgi:short-subunit dehydrogenase